MKHALAVITAIAIGLALTGCPSSNPVVTQRSHSPAHMNVEKVKGDVIVDLYAGTVPLPKLFYDMDNMPRVASNDSYVVFVNSGPWPYWDYNYPAGERFPYAYSYAVDASFDGVDLPAYDENQVQWGLALRFDDDAIPMTIVVNDFIRGKSNRINLNDYVPDRVKHIVDICIVATYPGMRPSYCPFGQAASGTLCWAKLKNFTLSVNGETVTEEVDSAGHGLGFVEIGWPFDQAQKYILSTIVDGSGTVVGAGSYDPGTKVTVSAIAANGWSFDYFMVNDVKGTNNPATVTMNSDVTVVANFKQNIVPVTRYSLTTSVSGQGTLSGGGTYDAGTQVTLTAAASSGWHFDHFTIAGVNSSGNPAQVTLNSNMSATAYFVQNAIATYTVATSVSGLGTVTGGGSYNVGAVATISAIAAVNWHFDHFTVGGVSNTTNPVVITVTGNVSVVAYFVQDTPPIVNAAGVEFTRDGSTGTVRINPGTYSLRSITADASAAYLPAGATFSDINGIGVEIVNLPSPFWYLREMSSGTMTQNGWSTTIPLDGNGTDNNGASKTVPLANWTTGHAIPFYTIASVPGRIFSLNTGANKGTLNGQALPVDVVGFIWP